MYEIRKDGGVIATLDRLQYVKQQRDGTIINCSERDAQGICVNDVFYHLPWLPPLAGTVDVEVKEFSGVAALAEIAKELGVLADG